MQTLLSVFQVKSCKQQKSTDACLGFSQYDFFSLRERETFPRKWLWILSSYQSVSFQTYTIMFFNHFQFCIIHLSLCVNILSLNSSTKCCLNRFTRIREIYRFREIIVKPWIETLCKHTIFPFIIIMHVWVISR